MQQATSIILSTVIFWWDRHFQVYHDVKRKQLEDTVGHFSKFVGRNEEMEQNLFNKDFKMKSEKLIGH